jgi:hypothetical protein
VSISTLTTLAATRDQRKPTRKDIGKGTPGVTDADDATTTDVLVTLIPTEFVAPYTALVAAIVGTAVLGDEHRFVRWLVFGVLVAGTFAAVGLLGPRKSKDEGRRRRLHAGEGFAAAVAAAGWALATPGSPLTPYLAGSQKAYMPLVAGFIALVILVPLTGPLTAKKSTDPKPGGDTQPAAA